MVLPLIEASITKSRFFHYDYWRYGYGWVLAKLFRTPLCVLRWRRSRLIRRLTMSPIIMRWFRVWWLRNIAFSAVTTIDIQVGKIFQIIFCLLCEDPMKPFWWHKLVVAVSLSPTRLATVSSE
uniref:Uncharacterized protein n=1 Tax=Meloidogyne incognita TaxID=6306 RepID=A0A914NH84_MELIC